MDEDVQETSSATLSSFVNTHCNTPRQPTTQSEDQGNGELKSSRVQVETTTGAKSGTIPSLTARYSTTLDYGDTGPPPDGGTLACIQVLMVHFTVTGTWGYITSFGVFQTYYETALDVSQSAISWLGSVQIFLLFFIGTFSGRAVDAGYFHHVYVLGSVLQLLGIFATSAATTYWQLFLGESALVSAKSFQLHLANIQIFVPAQALCSGLANGFHFTPAVALLSTYFVKKRALAMGLGVLGSCKNESTTTLETY